MSIFGQLDAAAIPTSPFFVEKGTYSAEVIAARFQTNKDQQRQLYIQYQITNEDSQYLGSKVVRTYNLVDPDLTAETLALMPTDEQKKIRQNNAALKRDLCGNDNNSTQKGLGVDINDLNDPNWDPAILVGRKVEIGIANYGANNEGVNVRWVNLAD
jgi:hypothetical protein